MDTKTDDILIEEVHDIWLKFIKMVTNSNGKFFEYIPLLILALDEIKMTIFEKYTEAELREDLDLTMRKLDEHSRENN